MTRRRGFTLIEVLTVIGIIIILIAIVAFGLSKVTGSAKATSTATTMSVMRSMLAEYEVATKGLNRQPPYMWRTDGNNGQWVAADNFNIWRDGDPTDGPSSTSNTIEPDPAKADRGQISKDAGSLRYEMPSIANTQLVMSLLLQAPGNKKLIEQMSAAQLMEELPTGLNAAQVKITIRTATGAGTMPYDTGAANRNPSPPIILDAWSNPIIFVPAGGMYDVRTGDVTRGMTKGLTGPDDPGPIRSPDGRPFFVSAGPDGIFSYVDMNQSGTFDAGVDIAGGDDNIYSFDSH